MKFSVNWLRELVDLPASVDELAHLLTFAGVEIEGIEHRGLKLENVVVGQINASSQHPNADRLSVCEVDDGTNHQRQIVCGAKNYKVGDKVPVALPGAALPNGLRIKVSKLRGVESQGMLCSPVELGVSTESDGLLILAPDAKIGTPIGSFFPPDTVLDVEITPNRSDLLSYLGLAREIAALTNKKLRLPEIAEPKTTQNDTVQIGATRECPFYSARSIANIKVGPSPEWLRAKLESAGLRSINNIVDITNFVMLELGEPLHAFDADKLQGGIRVRLAHDREKFLALDGRTYALTPQNLMIADEARAIAIGGVMGGEDTGVSETTRNLLLESAYFLPSSIRRTARTLSLPSDASYRFERGVDPGIILRASARATQLIAELAGGQPAAETVVAGELPAAPAEVTLRHARCDQVLGVTLPPAEIERSLTALGLTNVNQSAEATTWKIPSYRPDLRREIDLIEEVLCLYGVDKIAPRMCSRFTPVSEADRNYDFDAQLKETLRALGLSEARTSALIPRSSGSGAFRANAYELRNPLSEDHVALRPSLLPGLLATLERNLRLGAGSVRLFELGRIFASANGEETRQLALVFCGKTQSQPHWRASDGKRPLDLFDLKGALDAVADSAFTLQRTTHADLSLAASIALHGETIGLLGQLNRERAGELGATDPVVVAEFQVSALQNAQAGRRTFRELDKFPFVTRDIAMLVPNELSHADILRAIHDAQEPLLARVELFDLFRGHNSETSSENQKSLAYTLTYRDKNRTLTNDEVSAAHAKIRERLQRELRVMLRE